MSVDKTGGPAFPLTDSEGSVHSSGMTLRDYAAIKFAAAMLANTGHCDQIHQHDKRQELAFKEADAFLKARQA